MKAYAQDSSVSAGILSIPMNYNEYQQRKACLFSLMVFLAQCPNPNFSLSLTCHPDPWHIRGCYWDPAIALCTTIYYSPRNKLLLKRYNRLSPFFDRKHHQQAMSVDKSVMWFKYFAKSSRWMNVLLMWLNTDTRHPISTRYDDLVSRFKWCKFITLIFVFQTLNLVLASTWQKGWILFIFQGLNTNFSKIKI